MPEKIPKSVYLVISRNTNPPVVIAHLVHDCGAEGRNLAQALFLENYPTEGFEQVEWIGDDFKKAALPILQILEEGDKHVLLREPR